MARQAHYNAADHLSAESAVDPYLRPAFSRSDQLRRLVWQTVWIFLFRPTLRPMHAWRALLLRVFGAKLGHGCRFYPGARVYAPWNLICEDLVAVGDGAELYNPAPLYLGSHAIISQGAYVCGASHDFQTPAFALLAYEMRFGAYSWICARACVAPGVNAGEGAVLGLASVATRDLDPWTIYAGSPAIKIKDRNRIA